MKAAPDYIQLYVTTRCNLDCDFCFNGKALAARDMSFPDFTRIIGVLKTAGIIKLDMLGGEPTLHPDLMQFLRFAVQEGMRINLSSNGTDTALLGEIRDRCPDVAVGISVNDRKLVPGLEGFIRRKRIIAKTIVGQTLDAKLVDSLMAAEPSKLYLIYRDALATGQISETAPFDAFLRTVHEQYGPSSVGMVYCSGFLPDSQYPELAAARCPAGTTKLGILPDGSVYPCTLFFGFPEFRLGNILDDAFEQIWRHPLLSFFRAFPGNRCPRRDCVLHAACHGGCPAHSYAHHGKRGAPEPRCVRK